MAKNMTRKGLGLGAALSLVAATFVGATPAFAATVTLAPDAGTEYRVPISETFTLTSRFDNTANSFNDDLDVIVKDAGEDLASVTIGGTAATYDADLDAWTGTKASPAVGTYYDVVLTPATDDATFSVEVQTGFALSATGVFESTSSPVREVFFHVADDYTWNLSFADAVVGDTTLNATVTTSPALNLAQIESAVSVGFASVDSNGDLTAVDASSVSGDNVRFDGGEAGTYSATDVNIAAEADETVSAQTYAAAVLLNNVQVSDLVYQVVGAATIDGLTNPALVASANTTTTKIRSEATSFQVSVDATVDTGTADEAAAAGETVTFSISGNGAWVDGVATVGSDSYDADSTEALEVEVVADADGTATLTVAIADFADGDTIVINASAQGTSATAQTFTFEDTAAASLVDYNIVGTNGVMKVAAGSSYTLSYVALDNYGQPLEGDFYVRLDNGTDEVQKKISNGVASFALTDDTDATEAYSATLYVVDGFGFADTGLTAVTTTPTVGSSNAVSTVSAAEAGSPADLLGADLENVDTRVGDTDPAPAAGAAVTITGTAKDASGVVTWTNVTLSAPGVMFATDAGSKMVYSVGSITVKTSAAGAYSVKAYSNTSGEHTVTVTAGAATETVDIEFDAAAATAGASLVIDAPVAVAPGSTVIATATLTDEYGNPVAADAGHFAVAYDGPGLSVVTPSEYDANGEAKIAYFLGANDSGTITVTFSYSTADDDDFTGDDDLVVQKTIYIGAAPSAEVATWTKNLGDGTVKMYAKNIVGAGKVQFMLNGEEIAWVRAVDATDPKLRAANGFYYLVRTVELVEGQKNALEIYVDGERTTRTAYTY